MKLVRAGICSMSEGTLGLSREKCTLSKRISMTCLTPLPMAQVAPVDCVLTLSAAAGAADRTPTPPAPAQQATRAAPERVRRPMRYKEGRMREASQRDVKSAHTTGELLSTRTQRLRIGEERRRS